MLDRSVSPPNDKPTPPPSLIARLRRINLWKLYIGALFAGMVGMVVTHSSLFPQLMFLVTVVFIGVRVVGQLSHAHRPAPVALPATPFGRVLGLRTTFSLLTLVAVLLMVASAYEFVPTRDPMQNVGTAALLLLAGGIFLSLAIYANNRQHFVETPAFDFAGAAAFPAPYTLVTVVGILCLLVEAEVSGRSLHIDTLSYLSYNLQGLLFWGGVVLVAVGMCGNTGQAWAERLIEQLKTRNREVLALGAVLVAAFIVRAWNLGGSLQESIDDGVGIPATFPFLSDSVDAGLVTSANEYQTTQVYAQLAAIPVRIFGYNLGGVRAINVFFGTLNVLAIYLLARALFDKKMALVAALVLAAFPPHIHFSRLTYLHLVDAVVGTFTAAFLARGMRYNRRADWALAGISFGLTQYFFEAGRLFYPPLIAVWLIIIAATNFRKFRSFGPGLLIFLGTAIIIAMPTYYAAIARGSPIAARINASGTGLTYWQQLLQSPDLNMIVQRIAAPFLAYVHFTETVLYYGGDHPMILEPLVPLFFLGIIYLLWRWRTPAILVPLWLVATASANLLMVDSVENPRFIVAYPAIALAIAAAICYVIPMLLALIRSRMAVWAVTAAVVGVLCVGQVYFYYNIQLPRLVEQIRTALPFPDIVDASIRMASMPPGAQAYLISNAPADLGVTSTFLGLYRWQQPLPYLGVANLPPGDVTADFLKGLPRDKDYAFFVEPGHTDVVDALRSAFTLEAPQYTTQTDLPADKAFVLYYAVAKKQPQAPAASSS